MHHKFCHFHNRQWRYIDQQSDRRRRDIDNIAKALLDALQHGGVYIDDSQIVDLRIKKADPVEGGSTLVQIIEV